MNNLNENENIYFIYKKSNSQKKYFTLYQYKINLFINFIVCLFP